MIYYITGGQRSGKSRYAQELALGLSDQPVYLATSRIWDDDHRQRIARHQADRDARWTNWEEEKHLSRLALAGRVVVLDCLTLWLTNFFADHEYQVEPALKEAQQEFDKVVALLNSDPTSTLILVSNEIGMGLHPMNEAGRKFVDLQGWMNQYAAQKADKAVLMVSGLAVNLK
ncbi:MAG: bifunctional adenosylcobinamide kinase/adenosylcobinamide-phosphate guanylyltransferase [Bacteroidota bacterium]